MKNGSRHAIAWDDMEIDVKTFKRWVLDTQYDLLVVWRFQDCESMEHSSQLVEEIYLWERVFKGQVVLHADNGSAMKGATMLAILQTLGIVPSFSRPRVARDHPFSESVFKILKYCSQCPSKLFSSTDDANGWVGEFVFWYNEVHLQSGIKFVTPSSRHAGKDLKILNAR